MPNNQDLSSITGLGADLISNLFKGAKPEGSPANTPNANVLPKNIIVSKPNLTNPSQEASQSVPLDAAISGPNAVIPPTPGNNPTSVSGPNGIGQAFLQNLMTPDTSGQTIEDKTPVEQVKPTSKTISSPDTGETLDFNPPPEPAPNQLGNASLEVATSGNLSGFLPQIMEGLKNAPGAKGILDTGKVSEALRAVAGEQVLKGLPPATAGANPQKLIQDLFGDNTKTIGKVLEEKGVPKGLASILGFATDMATDPINLVSLDEAKNLVKKNIKVTDEHPNLKAATQDTAQEFQKASNDLTPDKTAADYQPAIDAKQQELLDINKSGLDDETKLKLQDQARNELSDLTHNQYIAEISDFKNNTTKRTIFPGKPNAMTSLTQTYMSNRGPFGGGIYRMVNNMYDTLDELRGKWFTAFEERGNLPKAFDSLSKDQQMNFFATMEGFEQSQDPVVDKFVKVAKANRQDIEETAIKLGVKIKNPDSSTGRFFSTLPNHMSHQVINPLEVINDPEAVKNSLEYSVRIGKFKDMETAQKVYDAFTEAQRINPDTKILDEKSIDQLRKSIYNDKTKSFFDWLVNSKQAKDIPDAIKRFHITQDLVKTGSSSSLEYSRVLDNPFYDVNPSRVLSRQYSSIAKRFGEIENFGAKNEIVNAFINKIAEDPAYGKKDAAQITEAINLITGAKRPSDLGAVPSQYLRDFSGLSHLSLSVIMNATQGVNRTAIIGVKNAAAALMESFTKEGVDKAYKAGVLFSEMGRSMYGVSNETPIGKLVNQLMEITGMSPVERLNRIQSALGGMRFAKEQASKWIASSGTNAKAKRALQNLGLNPDTILKEGSLNQQQEFRAARFLVNRAEFRSRVLDSPVWANSPWGKVVNQFKNFSENQVKFFREELINEAKQGNYAPIIRFLSIAPAVYGGAAILKDAVKGRDARLDTRATWQKAADLAANMGVLGMYYDILQSVNFKKEGWVAAMIPAVGDVGQLGNAAFEALRPIVGSTLGTEDARLLNLKPLTQFVAQRTPILGARLNDVLKAPEDKQKEASRAIKEASTRGLDVKGVIDALKQDKRINVNEAIKTADASIIQAKNKSIKQEKITNEQDKLKRAAIRLGLINVPSNKG